MRALLVAAALAVLVPSLTGAATSQHGSRSDAHFVKTLAPDVNCPGFPRPCRTDGSPETKDDAKRHREDAALARTEAKHAKAREAQLKEEEEKEKHRMAKVHKAEENLR
eukprot:CAMPEP_0173425706 /NCGR_PEP_ID=MMETSP1357-20121228/5362_1 /TAXON_ID=77926 /ORGANISM="Hemiselmis rufescens, Strain PCC563" /LENGTH=108 /DNA_ID=CAMNT_0014389209 /DNA_START=54 /DNA_END=377 /DNA_ORIENTATION=-